MTGTSNKQLLGLGDQANELFAIYDRIVVPSSILLCRIAAATTRQHDNAAEG
jgi:hypothetical protein